MGLVNSAPSCTVFAESIDTSSMPATTGAKPANLPGARGAKFLERKRTCASDPEVSDKGGKGSP
jgi:hypothetical protein